MTNQINDGYLFFQCRSDSLNTLLLYQTTVRLRAKALSIGRPAIVRLGPWQPTIVDLTIVGLFA